MATSTPPDITFITNVVAALAKALDERIEDATSTAAGLSGEAPAALVSLLHAPGLSVNELAATLGLAQPSSVLLCNRLEDADLIERRPGRDARTRALHLTSSGRERARAILDARQAVAASALAPLPPAELRALGTASASILRHLTVDRTTADHLCRLCDEPRCPDERCPVENAVPPRPETNRGDQGLSGRPDQYDEGHDAGGYR